MKGIKKLVVMATVIGVLGIAGAAYAATDLNPAQIVSGLTGKTVDQIYEERAAGKTLAAIAKDEGKLEEFKVSILEQKKKVLDQRVAAGSITQEQADKVYNSIKSNQAICNGDGAPASGRGIGLGFGQGGGNGMKKGMGNGSGAGFGINR
ncbi:MAG: DUF2680 domain-containing protein [Peptococcaceae bacterium]|nr:DUF2680 domain-containing protein [Peptococcaceae bacterium]